MNEKDKNGNTPLDIADKICSILLKAWEFKDGNFFIKGFDFDF